MLHPQCKVQLTTRVFQGSFVSTGYVDKCKVTLASFLGANDSFCRFGSVESANSRSDGLRCHDVESSEGSSFGSVFSSRVNCDIKKSKIGARNSFVRETESFTLLGTIF